MERNARAGTPHELTPDSRLLKAPAKSRRAQYGDKKAVVVECCAILYPSSAYKLHERHSLCRRSSRRHRAAAAISLRRAARTPAAAEQTAHARGKSPGRA
jgi:hypothetical protein